MPINLHNTMKTKRPAFIATASLISLTGSMFANNGADVSAPTAAESAPAAVQAVAQEQQELTPALKAALEGFREALTKASNAEQITAAIQQAVKAGLDNQTIANTFQQVATTANQDVLGKVTPAQLTQQIQTARTQASAAQQAASPAASSSATRPTRSRVSISSGQKHGLIGGSRTQSGNIINNNSATTTDRVYN